MWPQTTINYALIVEVLSTQEPSTCEEACTNQKWKVAMEDEIHSIHQNIKPSYDLMVQLSNIKLV